jgi:hypothetical protein
MLGIPLRLMGGLAIWLSSPTVREGPFARPYLDMDFAGEKRSVSRIKQFFADEGYIPEKLFNALHGARRLNFGEPQGRWTVDVVLDELSMSHHLDLRGRTSGAGPTLDLGLLLTKLQIWEINRKDLGDALCLLADHPVADHDADAIDVRRVRSVLGSDWGFCHTVERNLGLVADLWREEPLPNAPYPVDGQVAALLGGRCGPKSAAEGAARRRGELVETPEEVRHRRMEGDGRVTLSGPRIRLNGGADRRRSAQASAHSGWEFSAEAHARLTPAGPRGQRRSCSRRITSRMRRHRRAGPSSASRSRSAWCLAARAARGGERPVMVGVGVRLLELDHRCGGRVHETRTGRDGRRDAQPRLQS